MGYALWMRDDLAIAEGTHEYRAWGSAIIGRRNIFRLSDFRIRGGKNARGGAGYVGLFPSLEEVNAYLIQERRKN
jgi:hypothetical protein